MIQAIQGNVSRCKVIIRPHKTNNFKITRKRCACCNKTEFPNLDLKVASTSMLDVNSLKVSSTISYKDSL